MQHNATDHNAMQLNRYNTTATQQIATQRNKTDSTQQIATQHNPTQHKGLQHNATQHNKTGNKNHAHILNIPVEVTLSSTKNSTEKNSQKPLQVYPIILRLQREYFILRLLLKFCHLLRFLLKTLHTSRSLNFGCNFLYFLDLHVSSRSDIIRKISIVF